MASILLRGDGFENPLQDQKIEILVPERKAEVVGNGIAGPVALVENAPTALFPPAAADMLFRNAARPPDWRRDAQSARQERPAGWLGVVRHRLLLENVGPGNFAFHVEKRSRPSKFTQ